MGYLARQGAVPAKRGECDSHHVTAGAGRHLIPRTHAASRRDGKEASRIMKRSTFGALVACAVVGLAGSAALAQAGSGDAKACYRSHCGKTVKGYEGKCGGTKVDALTSEAACTTAGGAWTTAAEAKKFKKDM